MSLINEYDYNMKQLENSHIEGEEIYNNYLEILEIETQDEKNEFFNSLLYSDRIWRMTTSEIYDELNDFWNCQVEDELLWSWLEFKKEFFKEMGELEK